MFCDILISVIMIGCFEMIVTGSVTSVDGLVIVVCGLTSVIADLALEVGGLVDEMNGLATLVEVPNDSFDYMRLVFDILLFFASTSLAAI